MMNPSIFGRQIILADPIDPIKKTPNDERFPGVLVENGSLKKNIETHVMANFPKKNVRYPLKNIPTYGGFLK